MHALYWKWLSNLLKRLSICLTVEFATPRKPSSPPPTNVQETILAQGFPMGLRPYIMRCVLGRSVTSIAIARIQVCSTKVPLAWNDSSSLNHFVTDKAHKIKQRNVFFSITERYSVQSSAFKYKANHTETTAWYNPFTQCLRGQWRGGRLKRDFTKTLRRRRYHLLRDPIGDDRYI